jgi:ferric-dicitrate binding protein FerR (iron transport regulator)
MSLEHALAWRSGDFVLVNQPLERILAEIQRRFGIEVTMDTWTGPDSLTVILNNPDDASSILRDICEYRGCTFSPSATGYTLHDPDSH